MFSLELPENIIRVERYAFGYCKSLRNIALAPNTTVEQNAFCGCMDLFHIFGKEEAIVIALQY